MIYLKRIPVAPPWEAVLLPFSGFPADEKEAKSARDFLQEFTAVAARNFPLCPEVFLQLGHLKNASRHFAKNGSAWQPELGLGVWPDREPPTLWTKADFVDLDVGEFPKPLMYKVLRVGAQSGRESARNVMLGTGAVLQIMVPTKIEVFFDKAKELLLAGIAERSLRVFPFYVPLFEIKSITNRKPEQLDCWFCGASIYIRESREDKGVLIVASSALMTLLEALGAKPARGQDTGWELPV